MRTLVLGATGFVGSRLVALLRSRGHDVVALVRPESELAKDGRQLSDRAALPAEVSVHPGAIGDPNAIATAARRADVLFVAVGLPEGRPEDAYRWLYVAGFENVLKAARHAGVPRVVLVTGSDVVLGDEDRVHWDERRELAGPPLGARARALKLAEDVALSQSDATVGVTAIRPSWTWGPGDRGRLRALVAEARAQGGIDLCGDGKNLVATSYVDHVAEAALKAAISPHAPSHAFYVGDSEFLEMGEFLGLWSKALDLPEPRRGAPFWARRTWASLGRGALPIEEVVRRGRGTLFDTQRAATELGFHPEVSVDEGMRRMGEWYRSEARR